MLMMSFLLSRLGIRPQKPNPVKQDIYECGMETIGGRWARFNFRYYMYALLFVIFDVAVVFVYPWAVRMGKLGLFALIEMMAFITILGFGWVYAWRKRDLEWR
ncbi:MAG: NADH-quinone oxidoreductase subunit A [Dehalococcoidia bacterium]|nr:NADH-quinone oxidoreductase subunit A [Chloroflexota bacterium]